MHSLEEQCDATLPSQPRSRCHLSVPEALEVHLMHITACLGSSPSSGRGWGLQPHSGLGQDVSMPLEGTCDMWESFQVFPGTGRKMTFNFFSALQRRGWFFQSLCHQQAARIIHAPGHKYMSQDCHSDFLQGAQRFETQTG